MKVLDVQSLHNGIEKAISNISTIHDQISAIQRAVRDFSAMEDDLKGQGGSAIRNFYQEFHQPFLIFLYQSLNNYKNTLTSMKVAVNSYESNSNGYVSENFLQNDVDMGLDKVKTTTMALTNEANSIIQSVQDIVSVRSLDESNVVDNVRLGKKKADETVEKLHALDKSQVSVLESVKDDLQTMKKFITDIESKFKSGGISVSNFNVSAIQDMEAYKEINKSVYGNEAGISAVERENLRLDKNVGNIIDKGKVGVARPGKFNELVDVSDDIATTGINVYGAQQAYALQKKGFKIEQYVTKGGILKYRVFKPELIGIQKPTKRPTKIYDSNFINKHGKDLKIAEKVNVRSGAISGLKTKAGWFGVAVGTGVNIKNNIDSGASTMKVVGDAGVDVGIGAVSLAAAGAVSAIAIGTFGAPVLAGAAIGIGASYLVSFVGGFEIGEKTVTDHIKSGVQKGLKTIAGWFK